MKNNRAELLREMAQAYRRYSELSFFQSGTIAKKSQDKVKSEQKWLKETILKYEPNAKSKYGIYV